MSLTLSLLFLSTSLKEGTGKIKRRKRKPKGKMTTSLPSRSPRARKRTKTGRSSLNPESKHSSLHSQKLAVLILAQFIVGRKNRKSRKTTIRHLRLRPQPQSVRRMSSARHPRMTTTKRRRAAETRNRLTKNSRSSRLEKQLKTMLPTMNENIDSSALL